MTSTTESETDRSLFACRLDEVTGILSDPRYARSTRVLRLQGWRGTDLDAALLVGPNTHRLAPGLCASLALIGAVTGSVPLLAATTMSAVVGVFAPNHPF